MFSAETKAKKIMLMELGRFQPSYRAILLELGGTGYTHLYLERTANFRNLTSTAKLDVVLKLAECDLLGIETLKILFSFNCNLFIFWFSILITDFGNEHR